MSHLTNIKILLSTYSTQTVNKMGLAANKTHLVVNKTYLVVEPHHRYMEIFSALYAAIASALDTDGKIANGRHSALDVWWKDIRTGLTIKIITGHNRDLTPGSGTTSNSNMAEPIRTTNKCP